MTEEKEIREWLEELPDGYRERALENFDPNYNGGLPARSLSNAVAGAFSWEDTPEEEGYEFWSAVCVWAQGFGELPPLPEEK